MSATTADRTSRGRWVWRCVLTTLLAAGAVGVGVVFVAARQSQTAAQRITCMNKMKQLGFIFHRYHDFRHTLPTEAGDQPSFYVTIKPFVAEVDPIGPGNPFRCPTRRAGRDEFGKRDFGYAASNAVGALGVSILDAPEPLTLHAFTNRTGGEYTLLLTHVWMAPADYSGGDPTDAGFHTKNNARAIADHAKWDSDPSGSTAYLGSPHQNAMPSLFVDGHVRTIPYEWSYWAQAWAWNNPRPFPLP